MRRDDVALLREGTQIDRSSLAQEQVDHSTASLADEMIVLAGLGIESGSLCVQKEGADLTLVDETVKVAINGGETDPRQFFVNPLVDLMGERVSVIALESFEHLLQLACRTFTGGPPHRLTSKSWLRGRSDRTVSGWGYQIDGFLSSDSPGDPVSSGGVEREELSARRTDDRTDCRATGDIWALRRSSALTRIDERVWISLGKRKGLAAPASR